jgi:hypothetical protein
MDLFPFGQTFESRYFISTVSTKFSKSVKFGYEIS